MHHHVLLEILSATHRCGPYQNSAHLLSAPTPYQKPVDPFSAPKPPSGLFRPMTSPPVRLLAPRKAPRTLALLLDRLSGHPSFFPAPTIGAIHSDPPHPSSDQCFPRAAIAPQLPLETVDSPSDYGWVSPVPVATLPRSSNPPHCRTNTATRAPSSPELRRHLSFATRAPSSPELRRHLNTATRAPSSPELRRHLSFATRAPPSPKFHLPPELRRHLSFATRAPSSPELRCHLSFATRATSSPELQDQILTFFRVPSSTELRRHLHSSFCTETRRHLSLPELRDRSSTFVRAQPFT